MTTEQIGVSKKLRWAGIFVILSLAVQAGSLVVNHPLSFVVFLGLGGLLLLIGMVLYMFSLVF